MSFSIMEGTSECNICYDHIKINDFKTLECNHKLCNDCYNKLLSNKCPFCRHIISDKANPSYIPDNFQLLPNQFITVDEYVPPEPFSRVRRNMRRNRRRNLSFDEVLERRAIIKKRCKKKWMRKNGRLNKVGTSFEV